MDDQLEFAKVNEMRLSVGGIGVLICLLLSFSSFSQEILLDDFSSGVVNPELWIQLDTNITEEGPKPWGPGVFDASSGALNLRTTGIVPATPGAFDPINGGFLAIGWLPSAVDPTFSNGTVRAKFRIDSPVAASINLRSDLETFSSYNFNLNAEDGKFRIGRFENGVATPLGEIADLTLNQGEDWWVEASSIGNQHSMKVWQVGTEEPFSPQLTVEDDMFTQGILGLGTGLAASDMNTMVNATIDDVTFAVPEPNGLLVGVIGLVGLAAGRRRRNARRCT